MRAFKVSTTVTTYWQFNTYRRFSLQCLPALRALIPADDLLTILPNSDFPSLPLTVLPCRDDDAQAGNLCPVTVVPVG